MNEVPKPPYDYAKLAAATKPVDVQILEALKRIEVLLTPAQPPKAQRGR